MGQRHRYDTAGELYHVTNRGVSKRTIAENAGDAERFFELLADVVEAGLITVEAAVLMTTHFHLLLRSTTGEFWRAMRLLQNGYARAFNRSRRRDGPLFRGRYASCHVETQAYRVNVVRYIDGNPVAARMVARPHDHPFGSAIAFATGATPPWLDRAPLEEYVKQRSLSPRFRPEDYQRIFAVPPPAPELIERRLVHGTSGTDTLGRLLPSSPSRTLDWMRWKAELADGTSPGAPVCSPRTVDALVAARTAAEPDVRVRLRRAAAAAWPLIRIGLLRSACGLGLAEIAARVGSNPSTVHGRVRTHLELVRKRPEYAARAAGVLADALALDWPEGEPGPEASERQTEEEAR